MLEMRSRADWSDGYVSDIPYTDGFYGELAPAHLNYVAVLNGCMPRPLDRPFAYCELGCGQGHTVTVLAAANPKGRFYACDFNPTHVAAARRWADAGQVGNLTILEKSFEEMVTADLPEFDFVVLHGIYSWISEASRRAIVEIMARRLVPGGLAYVSYNCLPGWASNAPLQRLMVEVASTASGSSLARAKVAGEFLKQLKAANAACFKSMPRADQFIEKLDSGVATYIAHEFLNEWWVPFYSADVARDMAAAKMTFVGSATVVENHPGLITTKEGVQLLTAQPSRERRQLVQDFLINQQFRRDVFVKGQPTLTAPQGREVFRNMAVGLMKPAAEVLYKAKTYVGEVKFESDLSRAVIAALADGPKTFGELQARPEMAKVPEADLQRAVHTFIAINQVMPFATAEQAAKPVAGAAKLSLVSSLNAEIVNDPPANTSRGVLASPVAGRGHFMSVTDRCFTHAVAAGHADKAPELTWASLEKRQMALKAKGETLKGRDANLEELRRLYGEYTSKTLPILLQLGILKSV